MPAGSTNFPTSIDSNTVRNGTHEMTSTDHNDHSIQIEALQAKVGADSSAVSTSHDYKLSNIEGAWSTWVPTWTNLTVANGTVVARYKQVGKTVDGFISVLFGSSTAVSGATSFSLPVESLIPGSGQRPIGQVNFQDTGGTPANFAGVLVTLTSTSAQFKVFAVSGSYISNSNISSTVPYTFANTDVVNAKFRYEAA